MCKKVSLLVAAAVSVSLIASSFSSLPVKADEKVNLVSTMEANTRYVSGTLQTTKYGQVQGYEENEGKTLIWKGIPYAKAPVGELRWKAPVDPENWTNTLDATHDGKTGTQVSNGKVIGSEDCLSLDIYRPNTNQTNLPVLFYIHGGNNQTGASTEMNARKLAVNADCVVVAINYRMGIFGFNSLPALKTGNSYEDSGNYTLLDISKSLDWVKDNISSFGGNPNNITASGFSGGGRDVMAMLISPIFKDKFQKAISFSGGMTTADPEDSTKVIAKALAPFVVEDKVKGSLDEAYNWLQTDSKDVKDYLYNLSPDRLAKSMPKANIRMNVFPHLYSDGTVIPKEGFETKYYNDVPLIMSTGSKEFSYFARNDKKFAPIDDNTIINNAEINKEYRFAVDHGSKLYELFNAEESAERMPANYRSSIYNCDFKWGSDKDIVGEKLSQILGSYHGIFLRFLTDEEDSVLAGPYKDSFNNAGAKDLGIKFTKYISNFMWNGNPNSEGLVEWEPWSNVDNGPTQVVFDADKNKANITMSHDRIKYDDVLKEMDADEYISKKEKDKLIKEVLNGRWFSGKLDNYYGNPSLWIK